MTPPRRRPWIALVGAPLLLAWLLLQLDDRRPVLPEPARADDASARAQGAPVQSASAPFALLELFSSEGCSSCPAAEALLSEIDRDARRQGARVFCLAWHVDYWDHLGWKDPYAERAHAVRQRRYAQRMKLRSVYTPQLVVNGREELVGSSRGGARRAIERALRAPAALGVELQVDLSLSGAAAVSWRLSGPAPEGARLWLVLAEGGLVSAVRSGENSGRELHHEAVARAHRETAAEREGKAVLRLPEGLRRERASVLAFIQAARSGEVLGVARLGL
ncbi:MAG: DUF1223 domain-containing protein [Planctomycetota bacterium]